VLYPSHLVTGDKHLLTLGAYEDIEIIKPRAFFEDYLRKK
jgi:predicted nucleic acid-binding protein